MSPRVPTEELLLWATCHTHASVTIGVVCIAVPSCLVFRVESSVEQRDSPKGFLSWMNPAAWGTVGWKMQRCAGGKSALFYQAEAKALSVYHRLLYIAHVMAPIHLVLATDSGCAFIIWGSALVPWERPCCTWLRMEEKLCDWDWGQRSEVTSSVSVSHRHRKAFCSPMSVTCLIPETGWLSETHEGGAYFHRWLRRYNLPPWQERQSG